jgi:hypothetical protein
MPSPIQPPGLHVGSPVTDPFVSPQEFPESPLVGSSNVGAGVTGKSAGQAGVSGTSVPRPLPPAEVGLETPPLAGDGVQGTGENGVHGMSASATNSGVLGENSSSGAGVTGTSVAGFGLHGRNTYFFLPTVGGAPPAPTSTPPPPSAASSVKATDCGVFGESLGYEGVFGVSAFQHGVHGVSATVSGSKPAHPCGVWGESSAGYGVCATSDSTNGLWASSNADHGVHGETNSQGHAGVYAQNNSAFPCVAILASSASGNGARGVNGAGSGKTPPHGAGIWGDSDGGIGVYGTSKSGNAGQFDGNVAVTGDLKATVVTADVLTVSNQLTTHSVSTGDLNASGNINVKGDVFLTGADCAEQFDLKTFVIGVLKIR